MDTEEVVVCRVTETDLELYCHGGRAAVDRIIGEVVARGAVVATRGVLPARTTSRLDVELNAALVAATTRRTANIIHNQSCGVLRDALSSLRSSILHDLSLGQTSASTASLMAELVRWQELGRRLTSGWSIVLFGRPNAGKSSLTNALAGYERSIVAEQPGTTRDVVSAETAFDGWPVLLSDTAGRRAAGDTIEATGIRHAESMLLGADVRVLVIDGSEAPQPEDLPLLRDNPEALVVFNKADLPDRWGLARPQSSLSVSATTAKGVPELIAALVSRIAPHPLPQGAAVPVGPGLADEVLAIQSAMRALHRRLRSADWMPCCLRSERRSS
ncbi:MAG: GTP-binding protein [Planctomycetaceae bacterium]